MKNMIFKYDKNLIVFDDYVDETEEYDAYYVEVCSCCRDKYKSVLAIRVDDDGSCWGTCFVDGCNNEADYYVDFNKDEVEFIDYEEKGWFEAVEICPHCDCENTYPMWNTEVDGFVAVCRHCGKEIFLCDECRHMEDNPYMNCDWCNTECGGKCHRGITKD